MIVEKFRRAHPGIAAAESDEGTALLPVVRMQMPPGPDESRFFGAILEALGMPFSARDRIATKQNAAVRVMRATGVRLLVIDELHNLLSGSTMQQRRLLNVLRWLARELGLPVSTDLPDEVRKLMRLYPQPRGRRRRAASDPQ